MPVYPRKLHTYIHNNSYIPENRFGEEHYKVQKIFWKAHILVSTLTEIQTIKL